MMSGMVQEASFGKTCGLDEVGRGALAGPLVAAAVVLPPDFVACAGKLLPLVRDSKTLSARQRDLVDNLIRAHAIDVRVEIIPASAINDRGITWANHEVFCRLICQVEADEYIVDGSLRLQLPASYNGRVRCVHRADATYLEVSAASIVAKQFRDALMADLHCTHPQYGWADNVGYGTRAHIDALQQCGPCHHHRCGFVASALSHPYGSRVADRESRVTSHESTGRGTRDPRLASRDP